MIQVTAENQRVSGTNLRARTNLYLFFGQIFREAPTPELLHEIGSSEQAGPLAVEFARLFAVPGESSVKPYESVYCDTLTIDTSTACSPYFEPGPQLGGLTGFLQGPSTVAVGDIYRQAGFQISPLVHELPDHLAVELEFMGRLFEREEASKAKDFFAEHLGRWVFRCLEEIEKKSCLDFYRLAARQAADFLKQEQALFLVMSVTDNNGHVG
jgi:TorA maturation chaperone TorD